MGLSLNLQPLLLVSVQIEFANIIPSCAQGPVPSDRVAGCLVSVPARHYTQLVRPPELRLPLEKSRPNSNQETSAKGFRFAIVASRWNDSIVSRLIDGAREALRERSANDDLIENFRVPGSFEIPLCALKAAESGRFDAVICLGVIIRGETPHFEFIAAEAARGIGEASLKTGLPLLFGIITADNVGQANDRSGARHDNKGYEAALAAVELVNLYQEAFKK